MRRKPRVPTYGYDALKVLIQVWTLVREPCGKYLAPIMEQTLRRLEAFGELAPMEDRLTPQVREQLVTMRPATIDRMLKANRGARYPAARSATRPGATLRSLIGVRQAMDEMQQRPGFCEIDLVGHCGHSLKGEHAWTLTATDVLPGGRERGHPQPGPPLCRGGDRAGHRPVAVSDGRSGLRQGRGVHHSSAGQLAPNKRSS